MKNARVLAVLFVVAALAAAFWWAAPRGSTPTPSAPAPTKPPAAPASLVAFGVIPTIDDRFLSEPCSRISGGGLFSLAAFTGEIEKRFPNLIGVSTGDVTQAWGGIGRRVASHVYFEIFPQASVGYVAVGEGELSLGVEFLRNSITRNAAVRFMCANAVDTDGLPMMQGWVLLKSGDRGVLLVAVAADSLQAEITRRGSDVRLIPSAAVAAERARVEGLAQAERTGVPVGVSVLFVHGTVDEAAAIVEKTPGLTFAVAAHGATMPDAEPRRVGGVPIYYGGRGLRFAWRVLVPGEPNVPLFPSLTRFGWERLGRGSPYGDSLKFLRESVTNLDFETFVKEEGERPQDPSGGYVGGTRCADCHIAVAARHLASPHGTPSTQLLGSAFAASTECVACHMTAPYWKGGWRGPKDRTDMAAVSCEACHGPGEAHAADPKTARLAAVAWSRCSDCHLPDRTPGFDAQAAWKIVGHTAPGGGR